MKRFPLLLCLVYLITTSFYPVSSESFSQPKTVVKEIKTSPKMNVSPKNPAEEIYKDLQFTDEKLNFEVFEKAYLGFQNLKKSGKLQPTANLLSVCDFSLSSNRKRLWVIDLDEKKILFNSLVAHGKGTGEEFAMSFSNTMDSHQSSLGFYITEQTYNGDNGYSMRLFGMDKGYNDAALERCIVMHGANYVSEDFIKAEKRLGRSWGCPAVPRELAQPIINTIKDGTCLFVYYPDQNYLAGSEWLKNNEKTDSILNSTEQKMATN
ncbi:murein L,D-transpeptidase catalytic domain family protein [Epilithonimonas xixisoli]|uniref:L,D-transpeptidase-like protein n=1 Tax=Epilithonimonas xixisoli TaxID=1476462 RepID=A0A4R8IGN2_9FLAO|nr:murein L,D-transpeptidase catalytic domain family protein [Epilithonimonas xixisoli]TDX84644.1 L,D-transpeptidase-like protein [Epilithonimonas xixisoli]